MLNNFKMMVLGVTDLMHYLSEIIYLGANMVFVHATSKYSCVVTDRCLESGSPVKKRLLKDLGALTLGT